MLKFMSACVALLILAGSIHAETVVLVAGAGTGPDGGPAIGAKINKPFGTTFDKSGNMYIPEFGGERIKKIDTKGIITTLSGSGKKGHAGDGGPADKAEVNFVHNCVVGADGNLYIADTGNFCVRKIDLATNVISTFAGTGKKGFSGDGGPAAKAEMGGIYCIAFDPKGEHLFAVDLDNRRIRAIDMKTGIITTIAGNGKKGVPTNGSDAATSPLVDPRAVAVDSAGRVYILERGGNALRVVDSSGKIETIEWTPKREGLQTTPDELMKPGLAGPKHLCVDADNNVLIADTDNHMIKKYIPKEHRMVRIAGTGKAGAEGLNGPPESIQLSQPHGIFADAAGTIFISDSYNDRVLKIVK